MREAYSTNGSKKNTTAYGKAEIFDDQRTSQLRKHPAKLPFARERIVRLFSPLPKTKRSRLTDHSV